MKNTAKKSFLLKKLSLPLFFLILLPLIVLVASIAVRYNPKAYNPNGRKCKSGLDSWVPVKKCNLSKHNNGLMEVKYTCLNSKKTFTLKQEACLSEVELKILANSKCKDKVVCPIVTATPAQSSTDSSSPVTKRVMVLDFNPVLKNKDGVSVRVRDYYSWNDPIPLENQYIADITKASGGYLNYKIVKRVANIDAYPEKENGYVFTDEDYISAMTTLNSDAEMLISYQNLLAKYDVCSKVNKGEIDELWIWGGPWFGYLEAVMTGPGSYYTNGDPIENTDCQRKLHILGFNYERGNSEMLEDFAHRFEGTMTTVFGGWFEGNDTDWDKFTKSRAFHPNEGNFPYGCGTVHEPFNAESGYDWGNTDKVTNSCLSWANYPPSTTKTTSESCMIWNCIDGNYLRFWLGKIPKATGKSGEYWNNWWRYVADEN